MRTAASSRSPSAPVSVASGAKWRAMMSNSPGCSMPCSTPLTMADLRFRKLVRPRLAAKPVENAVHNFRLVLAKKGVGNVDIFSDHHTCWNVAAHEKFESARTQNRPQNGIDAA